jgi:Skp family chaperone for outer membrane proteins
MRNSSVRTFIATAVLGLGLTATASAQVPTGPVKIAYVNARLILQSTPGYAEAESIFTRELQSYRNEIQRP